MMAVINGTPDADVLTGTNSGDTINGLGGDDTLNGGTASVPRGGTDVIDGGVGIDTLQVTAPNEALAINIGLKPNGYFVRSGSGSYFVDAVNVERLEFTGGGGSDTVDSGSGARIIRAGAGFDYWLSDYSSTTVDVTYDLKRDTSLGELGVLALEGLERLSIKTGSGVDVIVAGDYSDTVSTGAGDDRVDMGGRGNPGLCTESDTFDGGAGTDTIVVDASMETTAMRLVSVGVTAHQLRADSQLFQLDAVSAERIEIATGSADDLIDTGRCAVLVDGNGGVDRWAATYAHLTADIAYVLGQSTLAAAGVRRIYDIERITLTTGSGDDRITCGAYDDVIRTGAGDDVVDLKTRQTGDGAGADSWNAGDGFDTLVVNAAADTQGVTLGAGAFAFTLRSASGRFHADATEVERVQFAGGAGADVIDVGRGGGSVDGNGGIDHFKADWSGLASAVSFTVGVTTAALAAGLASIVDVERVTLVTGGGADRLKGGAYDDTFRAGGGADVISGGAGRDTIDGGAGRDIIRFDTALAGGNTDRIEGFVAADDLFQLDDAVFTALAPGALGAQRFRFGAAQDADDRILYNATSGALFYDADGNGSGAARQFATLDPGLALTSADFAVY